MKSTLLLAILALFCSSAFSATVSGTLGTAVTVQSGSTTIDYSTLTIAGPFLVVNVTQSTSITLSSYANLAIGLPPGFQSLAFAAQVGFTLSTSNDGNVVSATLTTPGLSVSSVGIITGNVKAGCLEIDGAVTNYLAVTLNPSNNQITVPLPSSPSGTYVFVGANANVVIPSFYDQVRELKAQVQAAINYTGNFFINVTSQADATLNVTFSSSTSISGPDGYISLNAFWDIESSSSSLTANLAYQYNSTVVAAADVAEDTIAFAFYNTTTNAWQFQSGASLDASANVVAQSTNHFSKWAVYGKKADGSSSSGSVVASCALLVAGMMALAF